jgi:hypothetical protein
LAQLANPPTRSPSPLPRHVSVEPTSSVDARLREHFSDLVFSICQRCDDQRLYVVLEHKSAPEPFTAHVVDRYCGGITDRQARGHRLVPGLPITVSIVVHHGAGGWNAPRALHDLYGGTARVRKGLRRYVRGSEFFPYDVALDSDRALRRRRMPPLATLALWLFANAPTSAEFAAELDRVMDLFRRVFDDRGGSEDVVMLVRYILDVTDASLEALDDFFHCSFGHRAKEVSMLTTGERLRQEGRQQGLEQGRQGFLLMLLETGFGALPHDVIRRVHAADAEALDAWDRRVLTATALDDVFAAGSR